MKQKLLFNALHNLSTKQVCRKILSNCSTQLEYNREVGIQNEIIEGLYSQTIKFITDYSSLSDDEVRTQVITRHRSFDNYCVRHGMLVETFLEIAKHSNSNKFQTIEAMLKTQTEVKILLQLATDSLFSYCEPQSLARKYIRQTDLSLLAEDAVIESKFLADLAFNASPEVQFENNLSAHLMTTAPSYSRFILVELLKNALYASIRQHRLTQKLHEDKQEMSAYPPEFSDDLPSVKLKLTKDEKLNEFIFTVIDEGCGMNADEARISTQLLSFVNRKQQKLTENISYQPMTSPFHGLGAGLLLSRIYAEYFGGSLILTSAGEGRGLTAIYTLPGVFCVDPVD